MTSVLPVLVILLLGHIIEISTLLEVQTIYKCFPQTYSRCYTNGSESCQSWVNPVKCDPGYTHCKTLGYNISTCMDQLQWIYPENHIPDSVTIAMSCNDSSETVHILGAKYMLPNSMDSYCMENRVSNCTNMQNNTCIYGDCCIIPSIDNMCSTIITIPHKWHKNCQSKNLCEISVPRILMTNCDLDYNCSALLYDRDYTGTTGYNFCYVRWVEIRYMCLTKQGTPTPKITPLGNTLTQTKQSSLLSDVSETAEWPVDTTTVQGFTDNTPGTLTTSVPLSRQEKSQHHKKKNHSGLVTGITITVIAVCGVGVIICIYIFHRKKRQELDKLSASAAFTNNIYDIVDFNMGAEGSRVNNNNVHSDHSANSDLVYEKTSLVVP